jgi:hypothetical protein
MENLCLIPISILVIGAVVIWVSLIQNATKGQGWKAKLKYAWYLATPSKGI